MKTILKSNKLIKVTGIDKVRKIAYFTFDKDNRYNIERFIETIGAKLCSISGGFNSPQKTASIKW
jgi:hypothetical protein